MAVELLETENILFADIKTDLFDGEEGELSEFIITEIKEEPELIIEDEIENEKIHKFLNENDRTKEDRMNLVWYSCAVCEERFLSIEDLSLHNESHIKSEEEISTSISNTSKTHPKNVSKCPQFNIKANTETKRFKCDNCNSSYVNKNILIKHKLKNICGRRPYKCLHCIKSFDHNDQLRNHLKSHIQVKPYKCDLCDRSYALKNSLLRHRKHCGESHFSCRECNETFESRTDLQVHMKSHIKMKLYKCDSCDRSYVLKKSLFRHQKQCGETHYNYFESNKSFGHRAHLQALIIRKPYKCDLCDHSFRVKSHLVTHHHLQHGGRAYKCHQCDESFTRRYSVQRHIRRFHNRQRPEKPFKCDRCNSSYIEEKRLVIHYRKHTGERPYKCQHCNETFMYSRAFRRHMKTHPADTKPFKCDRCERSYCLKRSLARHYLMHTGKQSYQCHQCDKSFKRNYYLQCHIRKTHIVGKLENQFQCDHCDCFFNEKDSLVTHSLSHTNERYYKCYHCSETFVHSDGLRRHMKTHTIVKQFKCGHCDCSFVEKSSLVKHYLSHTNDQS